MSIKKLMLPAVVVAVLAFFGTQGLGATAAIKTDGTITAKEVRSLIVAATGATKLRGITPARTGINLGINYKPDGTWRYGQSRLQSASCEKGSDWKSFWVTPTFDRGTTCNGKVWYHPVKHRPRAFFQSRMQKILDHIIAEAHPGYLGRGQVTTITSNGETAKVYFDINSRGGLGGTREVLQIEGSKVERVCPVGSGSRPPSCYK
ncbi:MAG: hypothetical protein KDB48_09670 [Solirubrobacterales bacterium]|nr:hypothetical protein [Solirubrobacterales bacterium]MCB0868950.1 hypothetical protein [Solirubrobacterales bacterium]